MDFFTASMARPYPKGKSIIFIKVHCYNQLVLLRVYPLWQDFVVHAGKELLRYLQTLTLINLASNKRNMGKQCRPG